ncbi:MAG: DNA polymerase I [Gammaproteobacteria bacterium]
MPTMKHGHPKPFILIDGSSYLYRAFHALPPLTNSHGQPTGAVYGVLNMIRKLLNEYKPEHVAVVFDPKGKTTRDEIYAYYKANRPPMPDELQTQIAPLHAILRAMGLPLLIMDGIEADDVIGTLAIEAEKAGLSTLISTGDKDMSQLVNDRIHLINTMGKENVILDRAGVETKFGVPPERIVDYLALIGDTSDNIPGVPGVGPKTAAKWLHEFKSLDNLIKHISQIKGKVGENLRASLEQLPLAERLVTIQCDVPLGVHVKDLQQQPQDRATLLEWFKQLEFKSWLSELLEEQTVTQPKNERYHVITTEADFRALLTKLGKAELFAFDTETTDLDTLDAELVGVSFALQPGEAFYIPVGHDYHHAPKQLTRDQVVKELHKLFQNTSQIVIGQNLKYDMNILMNYGITINQFFYDTMLESYVLNSASNRHDMDTLALKYLGRRTTHFEEIAGKGSKQLTFNQISLEKAAPYACQDADVTLQLHQVLWPQVKETNSLKEVLETIELPLVPVLARMERQGVLVDAKKLHTLSKEFGERMEVLTKKVYQLAGHKFNLSSPKQLQEVLYEKLKLPILKKTPLGQASTAEEVLQELALKYPLPQLILEYRSLSKLKSTYTDALAEQIHHKTGRVHTSFNQAITATGRLSSTNPNLQNIPIRHEEGRRIRQAFIAPPGYKLISADYSQIELRIMAHLSQDKGLLKAFHHHADIHRATAAEVFNIPIDKVTSDQRRSAKAINFGLIYGMSAFGLAQQLGISREVAQQYIDLYFSRYPHVKEYMDSIRFIAHQQGYVETLFGRRLYIPDINTSNMQRRRAAERAAINAPMQGTAADIIKIAMARLDEWIQSTKLDVKMILQVHDELVFEVADKDVKEAISHIRDGMVNAVKLITPILVDIGAGDNWDEAHS